ncbi:hypothetical protein APS_0646 [Acetobacter pasteurianus subsp. pasteurianus LMG 1262 = NBRC 106471]|nr:hypothetical protein APS_0646 [Acetobacter pasteurianus subsp. pasteurianus LMG 1262 = NBRC 106471]
MGGAILQHNGTNAGGRQKVQCALRSSAPQAGENTPCNRQIAAPQPHPP